MTIQLTRHKDSSIRTAHATFGVIRLEDINIYTMEKPWVFDKKKYPFGKPNNSCIPAGTYDIVQTSSNQFYLESAAQGIAYKSPSETKRFKCGIGLSERTSYGEVNIVPGLSIARVDNLLKVTQVARAFDLLAQYLKEDKKLSIIWS